MWRNCVSILVVVPLLSFAALCAADMPTDPSPEPAFQIGLQTWFSTGESSWEISFRDFHPVLGLFDGRSRLEWEDLDSLIYRLHAEYRFTPWFRLSAAYGFGDVSDGKNTDTDWIALDGSREFMLLKSVSDTRGDITLLDINAYFRLNELLNLRGLPGTWDVVGGFMYYEEDLNDRNGVLVVQLEERVHIPFDGLDSTFRFEWRAFRLGLRGLVPLGERWGASAEVNGLFAVQYEGEAFWNLREDFRDTAPNFVQKASAGTGAEIKTALLYDFTPSFYGEIGVWWFRMRAKNGTDTTFFADGQTGRSSLDWVKTERYGVFAGLGGRF
jgi:hypothetical protein